MSFREPLPNGCPPSESEQVLSDRVVFRLVRNNPPTEDDFRSQLSEGRSAVLAISECLNRGVSVFERQSDCEKTQKLPRFRSSLVCRVQLKNGAGHIQQTFKPSHHTWWPLAAFNIVEHSQVQES
jgi:hypothetical protein